MLIARIFCLLLAISLFPGGAGAQSDPVPARAWIGEDTTNLAPIPLGDVAGDLFESGATGGAPFYPLAETPSAVFSFEAEQGADVRSLPLRLQLNSPGGEFTAERFEANGLRNVDPITGRPRLFDSSAACVDPTDAACLLPVDNQCDRAWIPDGDVIAPNPDYDPRCIFEGYGDRAFERLCEFTSSPGCAVVLQDSTKVAAGLSRNEVVGRVLGGDPVINGFLSTDTDATCSPVGTPGCHAPPNKGSKFVPFLLPTVQLTNDPGDLDSLGCTIVVQQPAPFPPVMVPCGGTAPPVSYLAATVNPEQEAAMGCGPFWGSHCDISGLDLRRSDASALLQSWPVVHRLSEAVGLKAMAISPPGSEIIDPVAGTVAAFRSADEYRTDEGLQPGSLPWLAYGAGEPLCSVEQLGGGAFPSGTLQVPTGSGEQPPDRDEALPGCHRKWIDRQNGYLNASWGTPVFQTDPIGGGMILDPKTGLPLQQRDAGGNVVIESIERSGNPDPLGIVEPNTNGFPDAVRSHTFADGGASDLLFSTLRPAIGPGHPFAGRRAVAPGAGVVGRPELTVPFANELAGLSWNFLVLSVALSDDFQNALETVGDLADPVREPCGGLQVVCGATLEGGSIPSPFFNPDPLDPNTIGANRRVVAQMLLAYCGSDYGVVDTKTGLGICRIDGLIGAVPQLMQLYQALSIDPEDPVATQQLLDSLQFVDVPLVQREDASDDGELEVNPPVPGPNNVLRSEHCSFITPQYCALVKAVASFSGVGRDFALPDVGPPTIARRYWLWETGAAHGVQQAAGEFAGHRRAIAFGPFVSDESGAGASSATPVLLEEPRPEELDLVQLRDGLVTRDWQAGLDWLDVGRTAGLSYQDVESGVDGWADDGWRHATTTQVCTLFRHFYLPANACPGATSTPLDPSAAGALGLPPLLGQRGSQRVVGLFDDGDDAMIGLADFRAPVTPQTRPTALWSVVIDGHSASAGDPEIGHFLVRTIPEPRTALLNAGALIALTCVARGFRSRGRLQ